MMLSELHWFYSFEWKNYCEWWIGKDVEGSTHDLVWDYIPAFALRNWEELEKLDQSALGHKIEQRTSWWLNCLTCGCVCFFYHRQSSSFLPNRSGILIKKSKQVFPRIKQSREIR
jgi:hypothetical protein